MGVFSNVRLRVTYHTVVCVAMSSAPKLQGLKIGCYPKGYAAPSDVPCQCNMRRSPSKLKRTLPQSKIYVTSKSPVGDISVVTLIRTDTTLDHSQKAEKVCTRMNISSCCLKEKTKAMFDKSGGGSRCGTTRRRAAWPTVR